MSSFIKVVLGCRFQGEYRKQVNKKEGTKELAFHQEKKKCHGRAMPFVIATLGISVSQVPTSIRNKKHPVLSKTSKYDHFLPGTLPHLSSPVENNKKC